MSITSFQVGTVTLGSGDTSNTDTLATTVAQGNSILLCSANGGSNSAGEQAVQVTLNGLGTTITAIRENSGSAVTIRYAVIESSAFTVQHFDVTASSTSQNQTITSVDTAYSFIISTGLRRTGGTRGSDDFIAAEITSATNVNLQCQVAGGIIAFQVVEMSSSEIASVQLHKISQSSTAVDTTITSVDTSKCLMFATARYNASSGGDALQNDELPYYELTSSTNLRSHTLSANSNVNSWVYVVEFVNMGVTHNTASPTGTTTTEVLGGAPTYGGAVVNGIYGRFSAANDTDDDSLEGMWSAALSGSTWTFTRGASTTTGEISYSVFDWDDLFAAGIAINATTESLDLTTFQASVSQDVSISAGLESLDLSTYSASVAIGTSISASLEAISLATYQASVNQAVNISANLESLSISTNAANIGVSIPILTSTESVQISTFNANLTLDTGIIVSAGIENLGLSTYQATVVGVSGLWQVQPDQSTTWSAQSDESTTWSDQSDSSTTWTIQ